MKPIFRRCQNLWGGDSGNNSWWKLNWSSNESLHLQWIFFPRPFIFKVEVRQPFVVQFFCWRNTLGSLDKRQAHLQEVRLLQRGLQARGNGEMRWGTGIGAGGVLHESRNGRCVILWCVIFGPQEKGRFWQFGSFLRGNFSAQGVKFFGWEPSHPWLPYPFDQE